MMLSASKFINKVPVPMRFGVALPPPPPAEDSSCSMANRAAVFLLTLMWNQRLAAGSSDTGPKATSPAEANTNWPDCKKKLRQART